MKERGETGKEEARENLAGFDSAIVFSKMAPRKAKNLGKRNNIKIKSKVNRQKGRLKSSKKFTPKEKPLDTLMWMNKLGPDGSVGKSGTVPDWLDSCSYKLKGTSQSSDSNLSAYEDYQNRDTEKYSISDASEECNCSQVRYHESKEKILKKKIPSTSSLVTKYIKSGMNQVASFIVESAIRFGEQHGVVVPDKSSPNVYEITLPSRRFDEKFKKIRFKIPEKALDYEVGKKVKWRSRKESKEKMKRAQTPMPSRRAFRPSKSSSMISVADSLEEILPILEKLKDGGDTITSDLDLQKLRHSEVSGRIGTRDRDRNRDRGRERERDRSRDRAREKERLREKFRFVGKRYKNLGGGGDECADEDIYSPTERSTWKKYKRDSVELVRQRLRNGAKEIDQDSSSTTPY